MRAAAPSPTVQAPELQRQLGDVARWGVVDSVDRTTARCIVRLGDLLSPPMPWAAFRAGAVKVWSPLSVGEQVMVLCPGGQISAGLVIAGVYQDAFAAPDDQDRFLIEFDDGGRIIYDPATSELRLEVAGGRVVVDGDLVVTGGVRVEQDVLAGPAGQTISLRQHRHPGVQTGPGLSLKPQPEVGA